VTYSGATAGSSRVRAYFIGTFGSEFASKALQVTFPLLLLQLSRSLSIVGFISALTAGLDTVGTLLGGWLCSRFHPRKLLIAATALRSASLGAIPALWSSGSLTLQVASGLYLLDALIRGVDDTARNTLPLLLVGKDKSALDRLNSHYQTGMELGSVAGSVLVGLLLVHYGALSANWSVPLAFAVAATIYAFMPKIHSALPAHGKAPSAKSNLLASITLVTSAPGMCLSFTGVILLTLYPLKALLPAFFADSILEAPADTAWLNGLFGVGACAGALLYGRLAPRLPPYSWLRLSTAGVVVLALGWIPGSFLPMAAAIVAFSLSNVMARLSMTSTLQSHIPPRAEGAVMGATRFSINLTSMTVRFMAGLAFALAATPSRGFVLLGAGLGVFALLTLLVAQRLAIFLTNEGAPTVSAATYLVVETGQPGSKDMPTVEA
jgi:predicted MFS family arabinose efflux permease